MLPPSDERGVSPVVGTVLMVAVVILLVGVTFSLVTGFINLEDPSNLASVSIDENQDNTITVQLQSTEIDKVIISNGVVEKNLSSVGESVNMYYGHNGSISVLGEKDGSRMLIENYETQWTDTRVYTSSMSGDEVPRVTHFVHDGHEYPMARGTAVLELTPSGEFVSYGSYDTHGGDRYYYGNSLDGDGNPDITRYTPCGSSTCKTELTDHLNDVDDGNFIVVSVRDQGNRMGDAAYDIFHNDFGSQLSSSDKLGYRYSWILVAKKGSGAAYERIEEATDESGIRYIDYAFYLPYDGEFTTHD